MRRGTAAALGCGLCLSVGSLAVVNADVADVPILSEEVARGAMATETEVVADPPLPDRRVDGHVDDWVGVSSRYGGTMVQSFGELVYQDHVFDAYGADDGRDAERLDQHQTFRDVEPGTYRLEQVPKYLGDELDLPGSDVEEYGNSSDGTQIDIAEVRIAPDGDDVRLLVRFTNMVEGASLPAVVLLADTSDGPSGPLDVGFASNLTTSRGDVAVLLADGVAAARDLDSGAARELAPAFPGRGAPPDLPPGAPQPRGKGHGTDREAVVAVNAEGFTNAIEARVPRTLLERSDGSLHLALAAGIHDGTGQLAPLGDDTPPGTARLANVAFRLAEPVRSFFEMEQALSLWRGTIDSFFVEVPTAMDPSTTERLAPGPGYHDRIFFSSEAVATESGRNGVWQHYGVYLPQSHDPAGPTPLQLWLHWRGGSAHTAGGVIPEMFRHLGDDAGSIVISPSGRGTSSWYVGLGHVDIEEVWSDVHETFAIDEQRTYVTGHSMGGWGSWLFPILYPDRFAASTPFNPPVTQGAWTGLDFPGCDELQYEEYTPCYVEANGSRPRDQHTIRLLENLRHVPVGVFAAAADELVPVGGLTRQVARLAELRYRHRYYLAPVYEHYTFPVMDQWAEAARYLHQFVAPESPRTVTYLRDMRFERATEEVRSGGKILDFSFDSAYWMADLEPDDLDDGVARFTGHSLAIVEPPHVAVPDAAPPATPDQWGPWLAGGLQWLTDPTASPPEPANGFAIELDGASAVTLHLGEMGIDVGQPVVGEASTEHLLALRLVGDWTAMPTVEVDGRSVQAQPDSGMLVIDLAPGEHSLSIR